MFKVMINGKIETAEHVKPAHIERKPEKDSTQQHKVTLKSKPTASKTTAKTRRAVVVRAHSTTTSKPSRTGVNTGKNVHA